MADGDFVLNLQAHPRPTEATGEITPSWPGRPRGNAPPVTSGPKVQLHQEAPAILYELPDGIRLITVRDGHAYYMSLGQTVSVIDGVPSRKTKGAFYEFAGIQETVPPPPPPDLRVPPGLDKAGRGWLIKAVGFTQTEPVPQLHEFTYRLESGEGTWTRPEDVNNWLAANGAVPVRDFFRGVLGWSDLPGSGGSPPP
jgi:hypothetical protein